MNNDITITIIFYLEKKIRFFMIGEDCHGILTDLLHIDQKKYEVC